MGYKATKPIKCICCWNYLSIFRVVIWQSWVFSLESPILKRMVKIEAWKVKMTFIPQNERSGWLGSLNLIASFVESFLLRDTKLILPFTIYNTDFVLKKVLRYGYLDRAFHIKWQTKCFLNALRIFKDKQHKYITVLIKRVETEKKIKACKTDNTSLNQS